jgi:hypothetical protein
MKRYNGLAGAIKSASVDQPQKTRQPAVLTRVMARREPLLEAYRRINVRRSAGIHKIRRQ